MNYIFKNINLKLQYSNWFIEVKFKISDNKQLNKILNDKIQYHRFVHVICKSLAGNILMQKEFTCSLDKWLQNKVLKDFRKDQQSKKYKQLFYQIDQITEQIKKLSRKSQKSTILLKALKILKKEKNKIINLTMKHVQIEYVHYCDNWIIGINGNKVLAKHLRAKINYFLEIKPRHQISIIKMNMINLKFYKTNFLEYEFFFSRNKKINFYNNFVNKINYKIKPQLKFSVPMNRILKTTEKLGYSKKLVKNYSPIYKSNYTILNDIAIIKYFVKFWTLISHYYSICNTFTKFQYIYYILCLSCNMTLSHRHGLGTKRVFSKYKKTVENKLQ